MEKRERISVYVSEEIVAKLRAAVDRGEYATTSEIVREALRVWGEGQAAQVSRREWLKGEIDKGRAGPFYQAEAVFAGLREHVREQVALYSNEAG